MCPDQYVDVGITDKLRKGKRDGTPEKPSTPNASQDPLQEEGTPQPEKKQVLVNEEILNLAIKPEDLAKVSFGQCEIKLAYQ